MEPEPVLRRDSEADRGRIVSDAVALGPCVNARVSLRLENGTRQELPVPEDLCRLFRRGARLVLYHAAGGEFLGWYLPDEEIGLDLRR